MPSHVDFDARRKRVQLQRALGLMLLTVVTFCWYGIIYPTSHDAKAWKAAYFPDAWKWVYAVTAYWVLVAISLFTGKVWGWYVASTSFFVIVTLAFQIAYPFTPSVTNVIFVFGIGYFLLQSAPQVMRSDHRHDEFIDAMADSLGIHWEEQPLWQMVQAGKTTEILKYFKDNHLAPANDYELMERLSENRMELKLLILKEKLQSLSSPPPLKP